MAVVIRLARAGAKKKPYYHVVVTDSRNPRDGKFLEIVGSYDPNFAEAKIDFKSDRVAEWVKNGAQPSDTVKNLLKKFQKSAKAAA